VNFNSAIELLERWGIISSGLSKQISKIKAVRNQLAHRWNEKEASIASIFQLSITYKK
jgi:uncharacterized protein YutE (UPF0331/DUF86 family)